MTRESYHYPYWPVRSRGLRLLTGFVIGVAVGGAFGYLTATAYPSAATIPTRLECYDATGNGARLLHICRLLPEASP